MWLKLSNIRFCLQYCTYGQQNEWYGQDYKGMLSYHLHSIFNPEILHHYNITLSQKAIYAIDISQRNLNHDYVRYFRRDSHKKHHPLAFFVCLSKIRSLWSSAFTRQLSRWFLPLIFFTFCPVVAFLNSTIRCIYLLPYTCLAF